MKDEIEDQKEFRELRITNLRPGLKKEFTEMSKKLGIPRNTIIKMALAKRLEEFKTTGR